MRVARLEIRDHPGIGDLDIDFRNADGSVPRLIVIAGENGCGKTAILQLIHEMLGAQTASVNPPNTSAKLFVQTTLPPQYAGMGPDMSGATPDASYARAFIQTSPGFSGVMATRPGGPVILPSAIPIHHGLVNILGTSAASFYSSAQSTFRIPNVDRINTLVEPLPREMNSVQLGTMTSTEHGDIGTEIAQLFVNLKGADDADLSFWVVEHRGQGLEPPAEVIERRIARFREAFATVMPHKTFEGVVQAGYAHEPMFREDGRRMRLADLSMGEKQIVLRGGFLLRSFNHLANAVVLIDEPELGLHPDWQRKILGFYDAIVPDQVDKPSQIIVTTHSPFVVHGSPTAKHVVLKRDRAARQVVVDHSAIYPGVTPEAIAIAAFDVSGLISTAAGNRMVVATEGKTDSWMISTAWEKRRPGRPMRFDLMPGSSAGSLRQFLGHEANAPGPLADMMASRGVDRVLGVFDFDKEGHGYWNKGRKPPANIAEQDLTLASCPWWRRHGTNVWSALLPVPGHRPTAADLEDGAEASILTTELLFEDNYLQGMVRAVQVRHAAVGVTRPEASNAQKSQIAEASRQFPPEAFAPFEPLLMLIERILQAQL